MKRIYDVDETCKRLNCERYRIREAVTQELANEFVSNTNFIFKRIDDNTLEVEIEHSIRD